MKLTQQNSSEKVYATQEDWDKAAKELGVNDSDFDLLPQNRNT